MLTICKTQNLPKGAKSCQHLTERAKYFLVIMYSGRNYYFPITKEMKRVFGLSLRGGKILASPDKWNSHYDIEDFLRDLIHAVYLQIRDTVGSEIHRNLSEQITEGFTKIFEEKLYTAIEAGINQKLLTEKRGTKND